MCNSIECTCFVDMKQIWTKNIEEKKIFFSNEWWNINFVKWYSNTIASILDDNKNIKGMIEEVEKLIAMSVREDMNKYIYLQSRRTQAQKLILLLDQKREEFNNEDNYIKIKKFLKKVLLENFTRQILPNKTWIIKKDCSKSEFYLNKNEKLWKSVLEPRQYIWIVPEAYSDLDAPSIVTALTPAWYTQWEHSHDNNYEITFYTWKSEAKYRNNWELIELKPEFWDFVIFPPKTIHTIHNPEDKPIMNISIKLPSALLDRWEEIDIRGWKGELRKMIKSNEEGVYYWNFDKEWMPYFIKIFKCDEIKTWNIILEWLWKKSSFYIIEWNLVWNKIWESKFSVLSKWDTIILDKNDEFNVKDLNWDAVIYWVILK